MQRSSPNPDPRYHVQNIEKMLGDVITHLRDDVGKVDEPKAQALFETGAEVLQGLRTAFVHYQQDREPGMRR